LKFFQAWYFGFEKRGKRGKEKTGKTSHFLFGGEDKNLNFVVPKAK
jgi:hypothetical protein